MRSGNGVPTVAEASLLQEALRVLQEATLNVAIDRNFREQQSYRFALEDQTLRKLVERVQSAQWALSAELQLREQAARAHFNALWPGFLTRLFAQPLEHVTLPLSHKSGRGDETLCTAVLGLEHFVVLSDGTFAGQVSTRVSNGRICVNREFIAERGIAYFVDHRDAEDQSA